MPTLSLVFGAKSQMRLVSRCNIEQCCATIEQDIAIENIRRNPEIRNFKDQQKALKYHRKEDEVKMSKTRKYLPVMRQSEAFTKFLHRLVGIRMTLLAYVMKESESPTRVLLALAPDSP